MITKSLDAKLARIHADPHGCKDFILADAKDADMALSIGAPGRSPEAHPGEVRYRSLAEFRDIITAIVEQKFVDIMLMSASSMEVLAIREKIFDLYFTTKSEGSGIGLAMTYRIIQLHHGSIEVQSKSGLGTEFILRIPLSATDWGRRHIQPATIETEKGLAG